MKHHTLDAPTTKAPSTHADMPGMDAEMAKIMGGKAMQDKMKKMMPTQKMPMPKIKKGM